MDKKFVEIIQDAACVIEKDNSDILGVFTGGIQSCLIYIFETENAIILIHDSGQLHLKCMAKLINKYGTMNHLTISYGSSLESSVHQPRISELLLLLGRDQNENIDVLGHRYPTFSLSLEIGKKPNIYPDNSFPKNLIEIPDKQKREVIAELNNFFLSRNAQSLMIDVQYCQKQYSNCGKLKHSMNKMLKILSCQPDSFFCNLAFLQKGHNYKLYTLPTNILNLTQKYDVSKFKYQTMQQSDKIQEKEAFNRFVKK